MKQANLVGVLAPIFVNILASKLSEALDEAGITGDKKTEIVKRTEERTKDEIANNPVVKNQANAEPWYKSRVTVGALVSGVLGVAGALGVAVDSGMEANVTELVLGLGTVAGAAITLIGRWRAKTPIFEDRK